jgi:hypothetical protein
VDDLVDWLPVVVGGMQVKVLGTWISVNGLAINLAQLSLIEALPSEDDLWGIRGRLLDGTWTPLLDGWHDRERARAAVDFLVRLRASGLTFGRGVVTIWGWIPG